jgi:hypothetical protein
MRYIVFCVVRIYVGKIYLGLNFLCVALVPVLLQEGRFWVVSLGNFIPSMCACNLWSLRKNGVERWDMECLSVSFRKMGRRGAAFKCEEKRSLL